MLEIKNSPYAFNVDTFERNTCCFAHAYVGGCGSLIRIMSSIVEVILDGILPVFNIYTGIGCCMTLLCGLVLSPLLTPMVVTKYSEFGRHKKTYWNTLLGSTVHAIVLTVVTCYALLFDPLGEEYLISLSPVGRALLRFSLGYFMTDFVFVMMDSEMRKDLMNFCHHTISMFGIWLGVYLDGVALFWIVYRFFAELSTTFVNIRWCMSAVNYPKSSAIYIVNSLVLAITFYIARIFVIPYHWYTMYYYVYLDPSVTTAWPLFIRYWIIITFVAFDILNIVWAYKIVAGGYKLLKKSRKQSE